MPYISHAGFILALVGHLTGSIWGFRGADFFVPTGDTVSIREAKGFSVKVDDVLMEVGSRGYPEAMSADVTFFYEGDAVKKHSVEMNSPLLYNNMAVYIKNVIQNFTALELTQTGADGRTSVFQLSSGEAKALGDGIRIVGGRINSRYAAMELLVYEGAKLQGRKWLSASDPQHSSFNFKEVKLAVTGGRYEEGAVLNVNWDPGVWIVLTGLAIFVFSLCIHLFLRRSK
jgi:cytochrome c biogenesis protein ResB